MISLASKSAYAALAAISLAAAMAFGNSPIRPEGLTAARSSGTGHPERLGTSGCLPREGLVLHLDANSITDKSDGQLLTEGWEDQSGSGNHFLPGVAPTYLSSSGGGYPAVRFNGTDQFLQGSLATSTSASVFIVFANQNLPLPTSARDPLLTAAGTAPGIDLAASHRNPGEPDFASFNAVENAGTAVETWVNGWNTADLSGDFFRGRYTIGTAIYHAVAPAGSILVGAADGGPAGRNDIREILFYNRALGDSERRAVHRYLGDKHGINANWRTHDHPVDRFNRVLGSQQFGGGDAGTYSFGESGIRVLDYARATLRQEAGMIKFRISNRYHRDDGFTSISGINSLVKLVRDHPEVKAVLDLPVTDILFWMSSFSVPKWQNRIDANGLAPAAQQSIYNEVFALAVYLLEAYSGTGKNFYLGNWEGDWMLSGTGTFAPEEIPAERIQAMIDWANVRQKAVDDAKAATPHSDVNVWFYLEMNKADWARDGRPCVLNSVIPAMPKLDFISISAYSMHKQQNGRPAPAWRVHSDLDLIQTQLDAKPDPSIQGSRLIVGEYGYQNNANYANLTEFAQDHITTVRDILSWPGGTVRFILQWQFFNDAASATGESKEMRQINEQMERLPLYYMHENFYRVMRHWVEYFHHMHGRVPDEREFADQADVVLESLELSEHQPDLKFTSYEEWRNFNFPDAGDRAKSTLSGPMADPLGSGFANLLRYALGMNLFSRCSENLPHLRFSGGDFRYIIPYDPGKSDLTWIGESSVDLNNWNSEVFDSNTIPQGSETGWVEVSSPVELESWDAVFYRLRVELAP
jgi:hypothetical protein